LVLTVVGWFFVRRWDIVPASGLPGPGPTFEAAWNLIGDGQFRTAYADTITAWAKSLVLASVVAIAVGLAVGWVPWLARAFSTPMHIGRSIPSTTLIPIAIVLFGLGPEMKLAVVSFSMSWLILMNTIYGVRTVDRMTVRSARSMRLGRLDVIRKVLIPSAMPSIMTGIRVAAGVGFVVTLSAELLGAATGVGTVMLLYQNAERADYVYAGVLLVALTGMVLNYAIQLIEHIVLPWRPTRRISQARR
jgi:ABC-type nitrate/sulfonate/bicarbonate transport system permease component